MTPPPETNATPRSTRRAAWPWILGIPLALVLLLGALLLFFPAEALRGPLERQLGQSTGQRVTIGKLKLRVVGFGLGLQLDDLALESPDGSRSVRGPVVHLGVELLPLLRQEVRATRIKAPGLVVTMRPPTPGASTGDDAAPPSGALPGEKTPGAFIAPDIHITDGRIVMEGATGTTRLEGVTLTGDFRSGTDGGQFKGKVAVDSVLMMPTTPGAPPLVLPALAADFQTQLSANNKSAVTRLTGSFGPIPASGTVNSHEMTGGWASDGTILLDALDLNAARSLLTGGMAAAIAPHALGGRIEDGKLTFKFEPDRPADYRFTSRVTGVTASLPNKGRVIDSGLATIDMDPTALQVTGSFRSGQANLGLEGRVYFATPRWSAVVDLTGPLAEAIRFIPPQPELDIRGGAIEAHVTAGGVVGSTAPPDMAGRVVVSEASLKHTAIAVPLDRFDITVQFDGDRARLADGYVKAGNSEMWINGTVDILKAPQANLVLVAKTIDLDELFPEAAGTNSGSTPTTAPASRPFAPVTGTLAIDRLTRDKLALTAVRSDFRVAAGGMTLTDLSGQAWGGTVRGTITLKPEGAATLGYSGHLDIQGMRAEEILAAYTPIRGIEGSLNTDITLSGRNAPGLNPLTVLTLLSQGFVLEGGLVNIPVIQKIAEVLKYTPGTAARIPFKTLRHSIRVENGFATLDTFRVSASDADWTIGGRIGLDGRLDCPVTARIATSQFAAGSDLARAAALVAGPDGRVEIGLNLGGTLASPTVSVDLAPLLEAARKKGTESLESELKRRLGDLLKQKP